MQRLLVLSMLPVLLALPGIAQGQNQAPPPVAPAYQSAPYRPAPYSQSVQYQAPPGQAPYYPQAQAQPGQVDPSVPGSSSLTPGEYVMTNRTTGQNVYVTVTPTGQMYTQDAPPTPTFSVAQPVAAAADDQTAGATATTAQQPASSKLNVVGGALKGALGMLYQWKYGGGAAGGGYYPMYGGYGGSPMYGGYAPATGGGGFLSNVLSRF